MPSQSRIGHIGGSVESPLPVGATSGLPADASRLDLADLADSDQFELPKR